MKNKRHKIKKRKSFKEAVQATPDVKDCYRKGKLAIIAKESNKIELTDPRKCGGSLFIDKCLVDQKKDNDKNRWDYAIDYSGKVYFSEVHTASTGEVSTVLLKLQWLKDWLLQKAPEINILRADAPFYWIQSKGYHIAPNSPQERLVRQNGLRPVAKLVL